MTNMDVKFLQIWKIRRLQEIMVR